MTYEGARSIIDPFMGSLGATATIILFLAFSEFVGYALLSVAGLFADIRLIQDYVICKEEVELDHSFFSSTS